MSGAAPAVPVHRPERLWPRVPHGLTFCGDANAVAVDSSDNVYVFNRGPMPVLIFDRHGDYQGGWGGGDFDRPHGIHITAQDEVWLVDSAGHFAQKRTLDGELLLTLGARGSGARPYSGEPFNGPTDAVVHALSGDVFVADGYGNSHIHRFTADGRHVLSWGGTGDGPGQLSNPHSLSLLGDDTIVVCDRENYRLQFFSLEGRFLDQWHSFMPCAVRTRAGSPFLYVAQMPPPYKHLHVMENLGRCVQVLSPAGDVVARLDGPGEMLAPHGLAVDSSGDVYIAELATTYLDFLGDELPVGVEPVSLRKWRCTPASSSDERPGVQPG